MGIKGLNTWIHASFPGVMRPVDGRGATYDHVLFDLNGIVHQACRRCPKEKEVLRTIIRELDELLLSQALHAFGEDQSPGRGQIFFFFFWSEKKKKNLKPLYPFLSKKVCKVCKVCSTLFTTPLRSAS